MRNIIYILLFSCFLGFSQANETIINTITIPQTNTAGNNLESYTVGNALRVFYVATNGSSANNGLSEASPLDIVTAFSSAHVQAGDWYWIKAGDYGHHNFNISDLDLSTNSSSPIAWVGYRNTVGDIVSTPYAGYNSSNGSGSPILPTNLQSLATNSSGTKILDSSLMPTFTGSQLAAPNYIGNGDLFTSNGGEQYYIIKNLQIQFYKVGFYVADLDYSLFDNIVIAHNGWFDFVEGQGGSNQDLRGEAFQFLSNTTASDHNIIKNCFFYNHGKTALSLGYGTYNVVKDCEAFSDINNGNPQDYYFHTIGGYNKFERTRSVRNVASKHSGHGLCFNQESIYNAAYDCYIYGTDFHFDGAAHCYVKDLELVGEPSFDIYLTGQANDNNTLPYPGGKYVIMDDSHDNLVDGGNIKITGGFSFTDSVKHDRPSHATQESTGNNNTFKNVTVEVQSKQHIYLDDWNSNAGDTYLNVWENCNFKGGDNLFLVERINSNNTIKGGSIEQVPSLFQLEDGYTLNPNTTFENITWINSDTARTEAESNFIFTDSTVTQPPVTPPVTPTTINGIRIFKHLIHY